MKYILFFISTLLLGETNFISPQEYAAQIYKNPRGIGCQYCHGDMGEGRVIASYIHRDKHRVFRGPAINNLDFTTFYKELNRRKNGMPRYYLTHKEIEALYLHLHKNDKNDNKN